MKECGSQNIELDSALSELGKSGLGRVHPSWGMRQIRDGAERLALNAQARLLTIAAIKPDLELSVNKQMMRQVGYSRDRFSDEGIAEFFVRRYIQPNFRIVSVFSNTMSQLFWENFYGEQSVERQKQIPALDEHRFGNQLTNRWEEAMAWMTSCPTTWLVLASKENHDAIGYWRSMVGPSWQLDKLSSHYPGSLRHMFQADEHNSLFHSSDSVDSVCRELLLISQWLRNEFGEVHNAG